MLFASLYISINSTINDRVVLKIKYCKKVMLIKQSIVQNWLESRVNTVQGVVLNYLLYEMVTMPNIKVCVSMANHKLDRNTSRFTRTPNPQDPVTLTQIHLNLYPNTPFQPRLTPRSLVPLSKPLSITLALFPQPKSLTQTLDPTFCQDLNHQPQIQPKSHNFEFS